MTDKERDVLELARGITAEVQPQRDLWPGIANAIAASDRQPEKTVSRWPKMFAQAAAVLILVGGSSALTWLVINDADMAADPVDNSAGLTFEPVSGSFGSRYSLGPDFQDARDSLIAKFDERLGQLPSDTRAEVEKNIDVIRSAITEINKALAAEPDSVLLQELLLSTYSDELAVMRKVEGISHAAMRRTDI
ncbi:MAG: hypothetical protein KDI09_14730 [Halioglobus sp.]|nr:hypothetical protein [Halioglobus sp.]